MKINIASTNEVKVNALKEIISEYNFLKNSEITSLGIDSGVHKQPKSIEETLTGAMNRAKNAFQDCDYSVGLESGLMKVPYTKSGFMDFCACAIYDGKNHHLGLSFAFEFPRMVTDLIIQEGLDANEAFLKAGLTKNPKLGSAEGAIGFLTKGRVTRKEYTKQAIRTALIQLENPNLY